jgi:hypothetical protein
VLPALEGLGVLGCDLGPSLRDEYDVVRVAIERRIGQLVGGKPRVSGTFSRQGLIWYLVIGGIVVAIAIVGFSFTAGREKAPKAAPAKEAPAKEKKGFFGKKK